MGKAFRKRVLVFLGAKLGTKRGAGTREDETDSADMLSGRSDKSWRWLCFPFGDHCFDGVELGDQLRGRGLGVERFVAQALTASLQVPS